MKDTIIPSKLFGEVPIPNDIITKMSNGDDDIWFGIGTNLDVNIFYVSDADGWQFNICPVKNGQTDTGHLIEKGKL